MKIKWDWGLPPNDGRDEFDAIDMLLETPNRIKNEKKMGASTSPLNTYDRFCTHITHISQKMPKCVIRLVICELGPMGWPKPNEIVQL